MHQSFVGGNCRRIQIQRKQNNACQHARNVGKSQDRNYEDHKYIFNAFRCLVSFLGGAKPPKLSPCPVASCRSVPLPKPLRPRIPHPLQRVICDGFQKFKTILGRNPDIRRNPYKNKVPIENPLYFYRAQPCTDITSFLSGPYFIRVSTDVQVPVHNGPECLETVIYIYIYHTHARMRLSPAVNRYLSSSCLRSLTSGRT